MLARFEAEMHTMLVANFFCRPYLYWLFTAMQAVGKAQFFLFKNFVICSKELEPIPVYITVCFKTHRRRP